MPIKAPRAAHTECMTLANRVMETLQEDYHSIKKPNPSQVTMGEGGGGWGEGSVARVLDGGELLLFTSQVHPLCPPPTSGFIALSGVSGSLDSPAQPSSPPH